MKPVQLKLQAFGSYGRETVIDFTVPESPIFLITGDTGAGKTTIFDAISFALFGESSGTERTLEMIDAQYGSLPAYLEKALGFTAEEQQKMKEKYLK